MTIEVVAFMLIGAYIATVVIWVMVVAPLKASRSRNIGRLNQKEWEIMHWRLAFEKANNDFMKLSEIQQTLYDAASSFQEQTKDEGWIKWEYSEATPYPLTLDAIVDVKFGDGEIFEQESVNYWQCSGTFVEGDCWTKRENIADTIVAYRVVN